MRKQCVSLVLLFFCVAVVGCLNSRITRGFDFSGAQLIVDQKDMVISAALLGTSSPGEKEAGMNVTVRSSPYTLIFVLTSNSGYYREAKVSSVLIMNEKNETIFLKQASPAVGKFSEFPSGNITKISFQPLELPYEKLFLTADVEIVTKANSIIKQPIQFSFEPAYSEEKSND